MRHLVVIILIVIGCSTSKAENRIVERIQHVRELFNTSDYDSVILELDRIEPIRCELKNDTLDAVCFGLRGQSLSFKGDFRESIPYLKSAYEIFEKIRLRQFDYLDCLYGVAVAYHRLEDYDNAEMYYRKALVNSVTADVDKLNSYRANIYLNLGQLYKNKGQTSLAVECFTRSQFNDGEGVNDIDELNYLTWENALWDRINEFESNNQYQEAVDAYSLMIDGIKERRGKGERYVSVLYSKALRLRAFLQKYDEAMPLFLEVIELKESLPFPNENVSGAYCNYLLCLAKGHDFKTIEQTLPAAIDYLSGASDSHYPIQTPYRFIGNGAYLNEDYIHAIPYYEKYLSPDYVREEGDSYHEITNMLAVSYIQTNNVDKAQDLLFRYLNSAGRTKKNNILADIYHSIGRTFMLQSNYSDARKYLQISRDLQISLYGDASDITQQYLNECTRK